MCEHHQTHAIAEPELAEHAGDVRLDGRLAEELSLGDLRIAEALRGQAEDVAFPRSQGFERCGKRARRLARLVPPEQVAGG